MRSVVVLHAALAIVLSLAATLPAHAGWIRIAPQDSAAQCTATATRGAVTKALPSCYFELTPEYRNVGYVRLRFVVKQNNQEYVVGLHAPTPTVLGDLQHTIEVPAKPQNVGLFDEISTRENELLKVGALGSLEDQSPRVWNTALWAHMVMFDRDIQLPAPASAESAYCSSPGPAFRTFCRLYRLRKNACTALSTKTPTRLLVSTSIDQGALAPCVLPTSNSKDDSTYRAQVYAALWQSFTPSIASEFEKAERGQSDLGPAAFAEMFAYFRDDRLRAVPGLSEFARAPSVINDFSVRAARLPPATSSPQGAPAPRESPT